MPRAVPEQSVFVDLLFPQRGLDLSRGYANQLPGTAPAAINVRLQEPGQLRDRGGSRPGLVKYVAGQVPEGPELIQHLTFIVDPTTDALLDDLDYDDPNGILDPSSAGPSTSWGTRYAGRTTRAPTRRIRRGGTGRRLTKNRRPTLSITANSFTKTEGTTYTFAGTEFTSSGLIAGDSITSCAIFSSGASMAAQAGTYPIQIGQATGTQLQKYHIIYLNGVMTVGGGIEFVQSVSAQYNTVAANANLLIPNPVVSGNTLVVAVAKFGPSPSITVTDSLGHTYTHIKTETNNGVRVELHRTVVTTAGVNTVNVAWTGTTFCSFAVLEYSGVNTVLPEDGTATGFDSGGTPWVGGQLTPSGAGRLALAVFSQGNWDGPPITLTPEDAYNLRESQTTTFDRMVIFVLDKLDVADPIELSGIPSVVDPLVDWAAASVLLTT